MCIFQISMAGNAQRYTLNFSLSFLEKIQMENSDVQFHNTKLLAGTVENCMPSLEISSGPARS